MKQCIRDFTEGEEEGSDDFRVHGMQSVVALGLGCVGSGLVTLLLETLLGVGSHPSRAQLIWLFELTAGARCHSMSRGC
jgi:hypothetical protein